MDVWFCIEQEQSPRGENRERKNLKKLFTRASRTRQESFFLLTKTYHGSPDGMWDVSLAQPISLNRRRERPGLS